jgi:AAHS family 4-hydroxybenzoate transporter-like MFS transporter
MKQAINEARTVDVQDFIDSQHFSGFHWTVLVLCFLVVALDGFDTGAMGFIAPSLVQDWKISRDTLGPVLSAALVGLGVGALMAGPIADRIGRKAVLIGSVFFFGAWSIAAARATSMEELTVFRFLTGLGLGAAVPNAVTLMSEYAPRRVRGFVVNAMFMGFAAGLAMGGVVAALLIPRFGWQSVLLTGGVAPLLLTVALILLLPESVKFLVVRHRSSVKVEQLLRRLAPGTPLDGCVFVSEEPAGADTDKRGPVSQLLSRRYRLGTFMLWLSYFMCLAVFYLLTNWLPTLFKASGFTLRASVVTTSLFHVGGCLGILVAGWMMDRFKAVRVVALFYVLTAALVIVVGLSLGHPEWLGALIFVAGVAMSGAAASMAPIAAEFYPTTSRATGVAWLLAIGRLGAVGGAFGGAVLMGLGWHFGSIFGLLAAPLSIAALALIVMAREPLYTEHDLRDDGVVAAPRSPS